MRYTLYHSTSPGAASTIMAAGFAGNDIWLANSPWKIGVKGEQVIELTIDLDEELMSFAPSDKEFAHVQLSSDFINAKVLTKRILDDAERTRLIEERKPPGSWPGQRR
jgi:hypothetical protein